jgi:hypothetical protein
MHFAADEAQDLFEMGLDQVIKSPLKEIIQKEATLELLTIENLDNSSGKVRYTTALRAKGKVYIFFHSALP